MQTLVDEGRISAEEAEHHPQRSLILRALDGRGRVEPDIDVIPARDGDRFLVCSDGLSGFVSVEDMTAALGTGDIETAADRLIELALEAGAPDNVTCLIAEVYESDDTGILPLTADGERAEPRRLLVGAAAEPDAPWSGGASPLSTEQPDRRLHDPEDDSEENEAELARYAPRPPSRFRWARRVVILLVVVGVLGGLAYAGQQWTKTQYYVGVENDQVAIYQGIDQQMVGMSLSEVYEVLRGADRHAADVRPYGDRGDRSPRTASTTPAASPTGSDAGGDLRAVPGAGGGATTPASNRRRPPSRPRLHPGRRPRRRPALATTSGRRTTGPVTEPTTEDTTSPETSESHAGVRGAGLRRPGHARGVRGGRLVTATRATGGPGGPRTGR